ncbi:MAG: DUF4038 domain-containing protein [Bryobacteraceae bacterium]
MRNAILCILYTACGGAQQFQLQSPAPVPRYGIAEFSLHITSPRFPNPFTEPAPTAEITTPTGAKHIFTGFSDSNDGSLFRLRFSPSQPGAHRFLVRMGAFRQKGEFTAEASPNQGPVDVDPDHPKHFRYATGAPFFHLGYTAYHLLDPSKTDAEVEALLDYCGRNGFNKIRFLLSGYPRDTETRTSTDNEHGVPDPKRAPNYGAPKGRVNPLPAWPGQPHAYDFTRFHLPFWRRAEAIIASMQRRAIQANIILTIEKQNLPDEFGRLTDHELRFYRYAFSRLGAYSNVWWDLGNEHNEYRDKAWGDAMGAVLRALDPHQRLASVHAYADFWYTQSNWASYIVTQQYGTETEVYNWVRKYENTPKPYVNEEYGYEGPANTPGHLQNADWTRRTHWAIAMAGGYATYGDWSGNVAWYYSGDPGRGIAATQLKHLRSLFETLPYNTMKPCPESVPNGFCLAAPNGKRVYYMPNGATPQTPPGHTLRRYDPRLGQFPIATPTAANNTDWVYLTEP